MRRALRAYSAGSSGDVALICGRDETAAAIALGSGGSRLRLCDVGCDRVHQWRRQAVIGLEPDLLQAPPDIGHFGRVDAGLDHRRHERSKARSSPAAFGEELGMDEIEAVERVALVLDAAVHMRAAGLAGIALDRRRAIDDLQLVAVFQNAHAVARDHGHDREGRAFRFPALAAAAGMIVSDIPLDGDLDRLVLAFADQRAAGEAAGALLDSVVNRWMDHNSHGPLLLGFDVFVLERDVS